MEKPLLLTDMGNSGHGFVDDLVPARSEGELVEGDCNDGSRDGPHPEHPLVVPIAGHQRGSKGARRVDAAQMVTVNCSNASDTPCLHKKMATEHTSCAGESSCKQPMEMRHLDS